MANDITTSDPAGVLQVIARAAADPTVNMDKMERLIEMRDHELARSAKVEFAAALVDMQLDLPSIGERGNAAGRYTYALWEDINKAIKPVLQKYGFALSFRTDFSNGIGVTAVLSHRGGHEEATGIVLPADPSGNKNAVQAVASSVSYGKRYTAGALLNLTSYGEDDDAFATGEKPDPQQAWLDAIAACTTEAEVDGRAKEMVHAFGTANKVPKELRSACQRKREALKAAS